MSWRVFVVGSPEELAFVRSAASAAYEVVEVQGGESPFGSGLWVLGAAAAWPVVADRTWIQLIGTEPGSSAARKSGALARTGAALGVEFGNLREMRMALDFLALQKSADACTAELAGPVAHDIRGALGVARLALQLLDADHPAVSKIENGLRRLSWIVERLPTQVALTLGVPIPEQPLAGTFGSVGDYIEFLRRIHGKRPIEFTDSGYWVSAESIQHLPQVSGIVELLLKLAPARAPLVFLSEPPGPRARACLRVSTVLSPTSSELGSFLSRRPRWEAQDLVQTELVLPYRLQEAARLALLDSTGFWLELVDGNLSGVLVVH